MIKIIVIIIIIFRNLFLTSLFTNFIFFSKEEWITLDSIIMKNTFIFNKFRIRNIFFNLFCHFSFIIFNSKINYYLQFLLFSYYLTYELNEEQYYLHYFSYLFLFLYLLKELSFLLFDIILSIINMNFLLYLYNLNFMMVRLKVI